MIGKSTLKLIAFLVCIIVLLPLGIGLGVSYISLDFIAGTNETWLGFWGGYLGAIVSLMSALYIFNEQSKKDKKEIDTTLKEQAKLTATFSYYEYLLEENKNLQITIQRAIDDVYQILKISVCMLELDSFDKDLTHKFNTKNIEILNSFNKITATSEVLYGKNINDLRVFFIKRYVDWVREMKEENLSSEEEYIKEYDAIIDSLNDMRTLLTVESLNIITEMKKKMK